MADRPASASSLRYDSGPTTIKVTHYELDPELRLRRSVTSDNYTANGTCVPCTVLEGVGGIIRGTGYVDPSDTFIAFLLAAVGVPVVSSDFDMLPTTGFVLDVKGDSGGSRKGYTFGGTSGDAKVFLTGLTGRTDDAGMIEVSFEIHSQKGLTWSTTLT